MRRSGAWRLRAPILGILVALTLVACAESRQAGSAPSTSPDPVPAAQAMVFVPVTAAAGRSAHGSCWTTSITVGAPSAYRCLAGNQILDPCFAANRTAHQVMCYADPWTLAVRVVLTKDLPTTTPLFITHPWALELGNGKRCVTATGVVSRFGGLALVYRCHGGGTTTAPVPSGGHTQVRYVASGAHRAVPIPVSVIWQV